MRNNVLHFQTLKHKDHFITKIRRKKFQNFKCRYIVQIKSKSFENVIM